jgi:hypothetical protein
MNEKNQVSAIKSMDWIDAFKKIIYRLRAGIANSNILFNGNPKKMI